jgi:ADP-heptose:LPS heptosyltransferase
MAKAFHILDSLLRLKRNFSKRKGNARGLLIISAGGLGDTVLFSLFASRFASFARKDELVTILLRNESAKMAFLFPTSFHVENINFNDFRKSLSYRHKIANRLFRVHYRLIIATDQLRHPDLDEAMIEMAAPEQALAMEPRSWPKYDERLKTNRRLFKHLYDSGPNKLDKLVRWNNFANWLSGKKMPPPRVRINPDILADNLVQETPDVLIQPFSAVALKQSPVDIYRKFIESLSKGTSVAIIGTLSDLDANPQYKKLLELPGVSFNSAFFQELVPYIRAAKLVISVDTATMHLAAAIGTSTLCLASAAYVGEIVPYAPEVAPDNVHVIYKSMDCEGCLGKCHLDPIDGMYPCVAGLDNDLVISKALELLQT